MDTANVSPGDVWEFRAEDSEDLICMNTSLKIQTAIDLTG
jgi:hypothetical protein